jgi:hypothetical protein
MTRIASTSALAWIMFASSCRSLGYEAHPLYEGEPRSSAEVARLSGPVVKVDGVDVSRLGSLFALLPGCHIVELKSKIGAGTAGGAGSEEIGHVVYAFQMKAGHLYAIDAETRPGGADSVGNASVGGVKLRAVEQDASGKVVAKLSRVRSNADIERCRAADANLRATAEDQEATQTDASIAPTTAPAAMSRPSLPVDAGSEAGR